MAALWLPRSWIAVCSNASVNTAFDRFLNRPGFHRGSVDWETASSAGCCPSNSPLPSPLLRTQGPLMLLVKTPSSDFGDGERLTSLTRLAFVAGAARS